jgi:DNA-binding SARP family transcriptional activator
MIAQAPYILSLVTSLLLAGMLVYVVLRRPRHSLSWCFAGVIAGLIVFYMPDVMMYQPGTTVKAGYVWQVVYMMGVNLTILSALALNFLLRDKHLLVWEWVIVAYIVVRMSIDFVWQVGLAQSDLPRSCMTLHGLPRLSCPPDDRLAVASAIISTIGLGLLIVSTTARATEPTRGILRRYILWIALLIMGGAFILQMLTTFGIYQVGALPGHPLTLLAILLGLRMFLAMEEQETGVRFSAPGRGALIWLACLVVAVTLDLTRGRWNIPVWTLFVLIAGVAGASAYLLNSIARHAAAPGAVDPQTIEPPSGAATAEAEEPRQALRIHLLGPMRVARNGVLLPNSTEVWRSAKTRSLLAYLALRRDAGATQVEIVDALWPVEPGLDGEAERSSLSALRSYLSTLRRALEPDGPRGSDRWIVHEGERYYLRAEGLWVDVWQFEALADQAEALLAQARDQEGLASWRQALLLYPPEGLLLDEVYLPAPLLESAREGLRQRWLLGLRRLARAAQANASAAELWESIHEAEPLDEEAHAWLVEHYRRQGNRSSLRLILQRQRRAEAELGAMGIS